MDRQIERFETFDGGLQWEHHPFAVRQCARNLTVIPLGRPINNFPISRWHSSLNRNVIYRSPLSLEALFLHFGVKGRTGQAQQLGRPRLVALGPFEGFGQ